MQLSVPCVFGGLFSAAVRQASVAQSRRVGVSKWPMIRWVTRSVRRDSLRRPFTSPGESWISLVTESSIHQLTDGSERRVFAPSECLRYSEIQVRSLHRFAVAERKTGMQVVGAGGALMSNRRQHYSVVARCDFRSETVSRLRKTE